MSRWWMTCLGIVGVFGLLAVPSLARAEFEIIDGWDQQLFPSYLVATATMRPPQVPAEEPTDEEATESTEDEPDVDSTDAEEEESSDEYSDASSDESDAASDDAPESEVLGQPDGVLGVVIEAPEDDTYVTVEIEAQGIMEASRWSGTLSSAGTEYTIYPAIRFNYRTLVANKQSIPVSVTYRVTVGDQEPEEETVTLTLRSINDCPFAVIYDEEHALDVSYMFAAYVNEQHPFVDKVLREALDRGVVGAFTGYQSGNPADVYRQVYAIWDALSSRDVRYSNITTSAADSMMVRSQHVRLIEESINNAQANCVDGSVLLASILRKIDIQPALVLVPGHCYLAFAVNAEGTQWAAIETTGIGGGGDSPADLPELAEVVTDAQRQERSWGTFSASLASGGKNLVANKEKFDDPNDPLHRVIPIAQARKTGVLPIAFDASSEFLSTAR